MNLTCFFPDAQFFFRGFERAAAVVVVLIPQIAAIRRASTVAAVVSAVSVAAVAVAAVSVAAGGVAVSRGGAVGDIPIAASSSSNSSTRGLRRRRR